MKVFRSPLELARLEKPELPVACARPERVTRAALWFQANFPGDVLYAVKANPAAWVIETLAEAGMTTFDVASEPEIELVRELVPGATLAFMHPVKSRRAIENAYVNHGCRIFALDSLAELDKIMESTKGARDLSLVVRLAVDNSGAVLPLAGKFGASTFDAPDILAESRRKTDRLGVSFHVGSQCMDPNSFRAAMVEASKMIRRAGVTVDVVNVGGGFPATYPGMTPPPMAAYMEAIRAGFDDMAVTENAEMWCEPGRALVADAESLVARVELRKGDALYLNDGAFGRLFDAAYADWRFPIRLLRVSGEASETLAPFRLFGPTCDSFDAMPGPFELPEDIREGDYVEIGSIGAYGVAMTNRFNGYGLFERAEVQDEPWVDLYRFRANDEEPAEAQAAKDFRPPV